MPAEIQLLACGYSVQCSVRGCRVRATMLARHTDGQGAGHFGNANCATDTRIGSRQTALTCTTSGTQPMPEKTIKRRLQDCDAARLSCHVPRGADLGGRASRISGADRGLFSRSSSPRQGIRARRRPGAA